MQVVTFSLKAKQKKATTRSKGAGTAPKERSLHLQRNPETLNYLPPSMIPPSFILSFAWRNRRTYQEPKSFHRGRIKPMNRPGAICSSQTTSRPPASKASVAMLFINCDVLERQQGFGPYHSLTLGGEGKEKRC